MSLIISSKGTSSLFTCLLPTVNTIYLFSLTISDNDKQSNVKDIMEFYNLVEKKDLIHLVDENIEDFVKYKTGNTLDLKQNELVLRK